MAMYLYTQSCEDATITLTNGGDSVKQHLQLRDLDVLGLDVAAGTSVVTVKLDFGSAYTADYMLLGNLTTSDEVDYAIDYSDNDADWTEVASDTDVTFTGTNFLASWESGSHRYWRVEFDRSDVSVTLDLSCIFIGSVYTFPVNYQYHNDMVSFQRSVVHYDQRGYPYGHAIDSSSKYAWDVVFHMTKTQKNNLITQLEYCDFRLRPFFFYDSNVDTSYHLCHFPDAELTATNMAADFYEVNFKAIEL